MAHANSASMTLSGIPGHILTIFNPALFRRLCHCDSERSSEDKSASIAISDDVGQDVTPLLGRTMSLIRIREYSGFIADVVFSNSLKSL